MPMEQSVDDHLVNERSKDGEQWPVDWLNEQYARYDVGRRGTLGDAMAQVEPGGRPEMGMGGPAPGIPPQGRFRVHEPVSQMAPLPVDPNDPSTWHGGKRSAASEQLRGIPDDRPLTGAEYDSVVGGTFPETRRAASFLPTSSRDLQGEEAFRQSLGPRAPRFDKNFDKFGSSPAQFMPEGTGKGKGSPSISRTVADVPMEDIQAASAFLEQMAGAPSAAPTGGVDSRTMDRLWRTDPRSAALITEAQNRTNLGIEQLRQQGEQFRTSEQAATDRFRIGQEGDTNRTNATIKATADAADKQAQTQRDISRDENTTRRDIADKEATSRTDAANAEAKYRVDQEARQQEQKDYDAAVKRFEDENDSTYAMELENLEQAAKQVTPEVAAQKRREMARQLSAARRDYTSQLNKARKAKQPLDQVQMSHWTDYAGTAPAAGGGAAGGGGGKMTPEEQAKKTQADARTTSLGNAWEKHKGGSPDTRIWSFLDDPDVAAMAETKEGKESIKAFAKATIPAEELKKFGDAAEDPRNYIRAQPAQIEKALNLQEMLGLTDPSRTEYMITDSNSRGPYRYLYFRKDHNGRWKMHRQEHANPVRGGGSGKGWGFYSRLMR